MPFAGFQLLSSNYHETPFFRVSFTMNSVCPFDVIQRRWVPSLVSPRSTKRSSARSALRPFSSASSAQHCTRKTFAGSAGHKRSPAMYAMTSHMLPGSMRVNIARLSVLVPSATRNESGSGSSESSEGGASNKSGNSTGNPGTSSTDGGPQGDPDKEDPKQEPWRPWGWISHLFSTISLGQPLRVLLNLGLIFLLIRLWPLGGKSTGSDASQSVVVVVPFSEFMQQVRGENDGTHNLQLSCGFVNHCQLIF